MSIDRFIELGEYRARTAAMYAEVRRENDPAAAWRAWTAARSELLETHPQSAFAETGRAPTFWDYDPSWRTLATVQSADVDDLMIEEADGKVRRFAGVGHVEFALAGSGHTLPIYWADSYGGGWFLPFRDDTNGELTFGSGRYVLDGAKGADLGLDESGRLVVDFNYSFHPSCVWGDWLCPLPHADSRLDVSVTAGEQKPDPDDAGHWPEPSQPGGPS